MNRPGQDYLLTRQARPLSPQKAGIRMPSTNSVGSRLSPTRCVLECTIVQWGGAGAVGGGAAGRAGRYGLMPAVIVVGRVGNTGIIRHMYVVAFQSTCSVGDTTNSQVKCTILLDRRARPASSLEASMGSRLLSAQKASTAAVSAALGPSVVTYGQPIAQGHHTTSSVTTAAAACVAGGSGSKLPHISSAEAAAVASVSKGGRQSDSGCQDGDASFIVDLGDEEGFANEGALSLSRPASAMPPRGPSGAAGSTGRHQVPPPPPEGGTAPGLRPWTSKRAGLVETTR
jgi:hypothetical protein